MIFLDFSWSDDHKLDKSIDWGCIHSAIIICDVFEYHLQFVMLLNIIWISMLSRSVNFKLDLKTAARSAVAGSEVDWPSHCTNYFRLPIKSVDNVELCSLHRIFFALLVLFLRENRYSSFFNKAHIVSCANLEGNLDLVIENFLTGTNTNSVNLLY